MPTKTNTDLTSQSAKSSAVKLSKTERKAAAKAAYKSARVSARTARLSHLALPAATDAETESMEPLPEPSSSTLSHLPVLADEVLTALDPKTGEVFVDGTLGGAGHAKLLLKAGARVYGIDQDPYAVSRLGDVAGLTVVQGNYRQMDTLLFELGVSQVDGVLLDIGVSSFQLDDGARGFSYHFEAPLDMRMSQGGLSAYDVVNDTPTDELAALIFEYGEDRHSRRIARAITAEREQAPITTTTQLAEIIKRAYPGGHARGIHPARRTFQALRIHVNDELGALRSGLAAASALLAPGGRLAVISFHSLEDRIVKQFLRGNPDFEALSKRPIEAASEEQLRNPRARSAKLRAARKVSSAKQSTPISAEESSTEASL